MTPPAARIAPGRSHGVRDRDLHRPELCVGQASAHRQAGKDDSSLVAWRCYQVLFVYFSNCVPYSVGVETVLDELTV